MYIIRINWIDFKIVKEKDVGIIPFGIIPIGITAFGKGKISNK